MMRWMRQMAQYRQQQAEAQRRQQMEQQAWERQMAERQMAQSQQMSPMDREQLRGLQLANKEEERRQAVARRGPIKGHASINSGGAMGNYTFIDDPEWSSYFGRGGSLQGYAGGDSLAGKAGISAGADLEEWTRQNAQTQQNQLAGELAAGQREALRSMPGLQMPTTYGQGSAQNPTGQTPYGQQYGTGQSVQLTPQQQAAQQRMNAMYGRR